MLRGAAIAGSVAGLAIWCTAGSLDRIDVPGGPVRAAMLPPLWMAAALAIAGAIAVLGAVCLVSRASTARWHPIDPADADVFLPLFASSVLGLPFLPWLSDWAPVWTVLAGPFIRVVWFVIAALIVRAAILRVRTARGRPITIGARATLLAILAASAALYGATAGRLAGTAIFPGGDEPHYLVIAQSIWRDGDLQIENNHQRGDTFEYFARPLKPHYLTRGVDRAIYSVHPVGLPLLLAPVYALGGYALVVTLLVLVAATAATLAWRVASRLVDSRSAVFGWLACAATTPWVFNSIAVYPEVPAALCVLVAFSIALRLGEVDGSRALIGRLAACGLAVALLPWLSSKYALMGAALGVVVLLRVWLPEVGPTAIAPDRAHSLRTRLFASLALAIPCVISAVGLLAFFWIFWGRPSPSAPYGGLDTMGLSFLTAGVPGLFFDQEYGIVAAAPVLGLALIGLVGMIRSRGSDRRVALEIVLIGGALLVTVGAFRLWWGGSASAGRPVIAGLLLLVVPCAWTARAWATSPALSAWAWTLLFGSLAMTAMMGWAQQGLLLVADKDGASRLFFWWSPAWSLSSLSPTFIAQPPALATLVTAAWLLLGVAGLVVLRATPRRWLPGIASLAGILVSFSIVSGVAAAVAPIAGRSVSLVAPLSARARSPLLDEFDVRRRPLALVYDPIRRVPPTQILQLVRLVSRPGEERPLAVPSLLNRARWVLPAGDYDVELSVPKAGLPAGAQIALQMGRAGPSVDTWTLTEGSTTWRTSFSLPVDVGFVGFKASPELAATSPSIAIRPRSVRDRSARLPPLEVLNVRRYDRQLVLFHDTNVAAEGKGFWTRGDSSTQITVNAEDAQPARLRLQAGPVETTVVVRSDESSTTLTLRPNEPRELALPRTSSPWRLELSTRGGFVPAELSPTNRDRRNLGCWIQVLHGS